MAGQSVRTNVGEMPIEDYREIVAIQSGFDSYQQMYDAGYRIGRGYDIPDEKKKQNFERRNER